MAVYTGGVECATSTRPQYIGTKFSGARARARARSRVRHVRVACMHACMLLTYVKSACKSVCVCVCVHTQQHKSLSRSLCEHRCASAAAAPRTVHSRMHARICCCARCVHAYKYIECIVQVYFIESRTYTYCTMHDIYYIVHARDESSRHE